MPDKWSGDYFIGQKLNDKWTPLSKWSPFISTSDGFIYPLDKNWYCLIFTISISPRTEIRKLTRWNLSASCRADLDLVICECTKSANLGGLILISDINDEEIKTVPGNDRKILFNLNNR